MKSFDSLGYFSENICYLRKKHDLSQKKMANILRISVASLRKIEQGIFLPRMNVCAIVYACNHFQISAEQLLNHKLDG